MTTQTFAPKPAEVKRPPQHRGERDTARDTQDWADMTFMGYIPKGPGQHRANPYAKFSYKVVEK